MARVSPFRPFRYTAEAGDLNNLVTQPYDKIPDELRERYLAASPYNFVRIIKGKPERPGDDVYEQAARLLDQWISEGVLAQDAQPGFYPYFQEFSHPETGERFVRQGFIGLLDLEEYEARVVHPHELTHRGPKADRLRLTEATKSYFGQLFLLYDDPARQVDRLLEAAAAGEPLMQAEEEGVVHRVWRLDDPAAAAAVQEVLADRKLLIADGHHRYETALAYRRAHPEVPGAARVMAALVNMSAPGLVVLATHRLLSGISGFKPEAFRATASEYFHVDQLEDADELQERLESAPRDESAIGGVFAGDPAGYLFRVRPETIDSLLGHLSSAQKRLDVVILHRTLLGAALELTEEDVADLKHIDYVRGFDNAVSAVEQGRAQAAFLLRPVEARQVAEVAFSGGVMPQKSTDFYPKLLSGFTTYRFG